MVNKKPLFFLSNDDGVQAKGLNELIEMLRPMARLVVMAPAVGQSGKACALTFQTPIKYSLVREEGEDLRVYSCTGTPADCVKLAFQTVLPEPPDLVIGGINHGDNSAVNVHYSGTMGVVLEGCMKHVPSVGYSLCSHDLDADFSPLAPYIKRITGEVLRKELSEGVCLNVNFPAFPVFKGVKICRQAYGDWSNEWAPHIHPNQTVYYWLTGDFQTKETSSEYDRAALQQGYVAITPIRIDMTDAVMLEEMKNWNL